MKRRDFFVATAATTSLLLASCGGKPLPAGAGTVDYILVEKKKRVMTLFASSTQVKQYKIHLGFNPTGHKVQFADGRTPEGRYYIHGKNPRSQFHLSLGISYPNVNDVAKANSLGVEPGGDVFIHGGPRGNVDRSKYDWTAGCIAVTDLEVEEIYAMVKTGAIIDIKA